MRTHVVVVESTIKLGCQVRLSPRTLILGPNRSGKSTIVAAIELALTGRASDVAGRATVARDADLFALLAPPGAAEIWAQAQLSDGSTASWTLPRGRRSKRQGPEGHLPLRDVREALLGEPDRTRRWLLSHGPPVAWSEVAALVPESLARRLASVAPAPAEAISDGAGSLAFALGEAKRRAREASSSARLSREAASPTTALGPPPSDAELAEAQAVLAVARAEGARAGLVEVRRGLAEATAAAAKLAKEAQRCEVALGELPPTAGAGLSKAALLVAEALATIKATTCAICGSPSSPAVFATRAARARTRLEEASRDEEARSRLSRELQAAQLDLAAARRDVERYQGEEARLQALLGEEGPGSRLTAAQASAVVERRVAWEAARRHEEAALAQERAAEEWSRLAEALSTALGQLVTRAAAGFEAQVQRHLPPGDVFGVELLDGEREVCRVGLRREGAIHAALSGAEWAQVTAALALATAPADGPVVVCPEERAFDPRTLTDALRAFSASAAEVQVIVASPVAPSEVPPGWTVVDLAAERLEVEPAGPGRRREPKRPVGPSIFD